MWCDDHAHLVRYYRATLEFLDVSRNLHRWVDIYLGCCLSVARSVEEKNVPLERGAWGLKRDDEERRWKWNREDGARTAGERGVGAQEGL